MSRVLVLLPPSGPASNTSTISASASVSVFVIELVAASHGRAEYKRCEAAPDPQQPEDYAEFECGGERGEFVYIRLVFGQIQNHVQNNVKYSKLKTQGKLISVQGNI